MDNNQTNSSNLSYAQNEDRMSAQDILGFLWRIKVWILVGVVLSLVFAFLYLKIQTRTYERTSFVMLNGQENGVNSQISAMMGVDISGNKELDNQVFIIQSPSIMRRTVERLNLNTRYYFYENPFDTWNLDDIIESDILEFKQTEIYGNTPFSLSVKIDSLHHPRMQLSSVRMEFEHVGGYTFDVKSLTVNGQTVNIEQHRYRYGTPIIANGVDLTLSLNYPYTIEEDVKYVATWTEPFTAARGFLGNLTVNIEGAKANRTDIVQLNYKDVSTQRAADILNTLVVVSNEEARKYKAKSTLDVLSFIDGRLADIQNQLLDAEEVYKNYQSTRALVNNNAQTNLTLNSDQRYKDNLTEIMLQIEVLKMIYYFMVNTPAGTYRVVPSYLAVSDAGLSNMIAKYNDKVIMRDRMVFNSSEVNPKVVSLNTELNSLKKGIELSLENLIRVYTLRQNEVEKVLDKNRENIADIPEQQLKMQELTRKIDVIEPLYLMLQKKREESQITLYSEDDLFRVIEFAYGNNAPVAPNSRMVYLLAFVIGFAICPAIFLLRTLVRAKVETRHDVESAVDAPILAVSPRAEVKENMLLTRTGRDQVSECFRMFRSNLQSLPDTRVLQVTSSVSGEGKSYVSSNLALSLAYVGKRVLLIGMDLRKPSLPRLFNEKPDQKCSLVSYLSGKTDNIDEIIMPSPLSHHLDIIFSGVIPPDPTVLLSNPRAESLISEMKNRYDYIVIDSAPYFPVTDSSIINKYVDATLYIIRCDYTSLKHLKEIQNLIHRQINPIKNAHIVMNDFNAKAMKYRYSFGEGYGVENMSSYGYTYGRKYGYGYGHSKDKNVEDEQKTTED